MTLSNNTFINNIDEESDSRMMYDDEDVNESLRQLIKLFSWT